MERGDGCNVWFPLADVEGRLGGSDVRQRPLQEREAFQAEPAKVSAMDQWH